MCLDNQPFIEKMLDEWDMIDCSPVRTPVTKGTLARLDEARRKEQFLGKEESTEFRSLLGGHAALAGCHHYAKDVSGSQSAGQVHC